MREVELFFWWMPAPHKRSGEVKTRYRMSREQAAREGAIRPDLASRIVIEEAETPEEAAALRRASDTARRHGEVAPTWWLTGDGSK